jgi:hypothetical protein
MSVVAGWALVLYQGHGRGDDAGWVVAGRDARRDHSESSQPKSSLSCLHICH